jgi:DNA repair exonuclease SbcCD nuclease subunit
MVRILLLADTHLGFDLPVRPRVERRRRGHDFFANFERTLDAALERKVDIVVHGGDLFFRRRIPASLVQRAFLPLKRVADSGIPVYVIPGNHERSEIPYSMLALHPGIHIFDRPRTFETEVRGKNVALTGFPFCRDGVRHQFGRVIENTDWGQVPADIRLLCVHQCFEGATVGPVSYTFRYTDDVIRMSDVPAEFAAVLAGHIHRHQVLTVDLRGATAPVPVLYPGSIERTSFAERAEPKGYMMLQFEPAMGSGGTLVEWEFCDLPARPMIIADVDLDGIADAELRSHVGRAIEAVPEDAVLRLRVHGQPGDQARTVLTAASVRSLAPATMNVEVRFVDGPSRFGR